MDVIVVVAVSLRKLADLLNDFQHRLPNIRREYAQLQHAIFRERTFEGRVCVLRGGASNVPGCLGHHLVGEEVEPRPSFMCFGDLWRSAAESNLAVARVESDGSIEVIDVHDGTYFFGG